MTYQTWMLLNTIVCSAIVCICICRLAMCHPGIYKLVRLKYTMLLTGAMAYGFQPFLFGTWPTPAGMLFSVSVLGGLLCSARRWRNRPPAETVTRPAELA